MPGSEKPDPDEPDKNPPRLAVVDDPEEDPPRSPLRIPESPDVNEVGDARPFSAVGSVDVSGDSADCTPVPIDEPAAWAPAAPCAANPARLVVCGAAVNGVNFAVVAAGVAA